MRFVSYVAACALIAAGTCGGWKLGHANGVQGRIDKDSLSATAKSQTAGNSMLMLAVPLSRDQALAVMKARHDGMGSIGDAGKAIHRSLGPTPDLPALRANSQKLVLLSRAASRWFPAGTGPDVAKTRAKPEIWQNAEDFAAKLRNFQAAAQAFDSAARGNDVAAMNARFADLNGTCKACHDKYRAEEKH
ncbi:MAG TPA: cytochrome c [Sphingomicrobium sp.]|jgi:cytochrome c556|nr:cytochrome c [Sphingomicrobium sp.]